MPNNATFTAAFLDHLDKKNVLELDVLETLVSNGADPNVFAHRFGRNVLHMALAAPSIYKNDHIQRILAMGLDPNKKDRMGRTPLRMLLDRDIKTFRDYQQIQMLIDAGAHPDELSLRKRNALELAISDDMDAHVLVNLINSGVPVVQSGYNAFQHYLMAAKYKLPLNVGVIQAMIIQGADPATTTREGDNALHIACLKSPNAIVHLLGIGVDVNQFNKEGQNPLAVYVGNGGKAQEIIQQFADASVRPLEQRQAFIAHYILSKVLVAPDLCGWKMEQLAQFKEAMIEYIRKQAPDTRKAMLAAALNPEHPLGMFFRFQRGLCLTIEGRGSLGILADMVCELDDSTEYAEFTSCSLGTGLMRRMGFFKMPVKQVSEARSNAFSLTVEDQALIEENIQNISESAFIR